jgi:transcriptional regulator GlxA family with amidase domain
MGMRQLSQLSNHAKGLNEARRPLRNARLPLDEIAMRSGFYSSKALDVRLPENLRRKSINFSPAHRPERLNRQDTFGGLA